MSRCCCFTWGFDVLLIIILFDCSTDIGSYPCLLRGARDRLILGIWISGCKTTVSNQRRCNRAALSSTPSD
jgi:hypothetical protein